MNYSKDLLSKEIVIGVIALSLSLWAFIPLAPYSHMLNVIALLLIVGGLLIYTLKKRKVIIDMQFKDIIIAIILLRFISSIPCYLYHNQSIIYTLAIERTAIFWLFYFFLHKSRINPSSLMKIVIIVAVIWAGITILQQLSYPVYAFATREGSSGEEVPYRAGVYRFLVRGLHYGVLAGLMFLTYFFITRKYKYLYGYLFFLAGIYFHSARQFIAGYLLASIPVIFFLKGRNRMIAIIISFFVAFLFITNFETLFAGYIEQTKDDFNEHNIRLVSYYFYGLEYFPHWLCNLFGNGMAYSGSQYGYEFFDYLNEDLGLFRTDVGIIGTYNQYGLIYCLLVVYSFVKIFFMKIPLNRTYLKLFSIYILALIVLSEYSYNNYVIPFFCIYYYFIDCYVDEQKEISNNNSSI